MLPTQLVTRQPRPETTVALQSVDARIVIERETNTNNNGAPAKRRVGECPVTYQNSPSDACLQRAQSNLLGCDEAVIVLHF